MEGDEASKANPDSTANIHLQFLGYEQCVVVPIPQGEVVVGAILPAARLISEKITETAVEAARREGRTVSCRAGCGACCRQLVVVSYAEAQALADAVAAMPAERQAEVRQRFSEGIRRLEAAGLLDRQEAAGERHFILPLNAPGTKSKPISEIYFRQQIACPFLAEESCGIYADRPIVCREYLVTNPPERCARLFEENVEIEGIHAAVRIAPVMVKVTHHVAGAEAESIPLILALEWAEAHADALHHRQNGLEMLQLLVAETQNEHHRSQNDS